ncbi:MAG: phage antirepressor N-terminal domain-containing protein [Anditalea sp.]
MISNNEHTQLGVLQNFEFDKTPVMAGIVHTGEAIALRPCVENLGLNWSGQLQAIKRNEDLNQLCVSVKAVGSDGKKYEMICLPPGSFQNWLWELNPKSENFNSVLWESYKKGLVMHLLLMLKMSMDEIQRTQTITDSFATLRSLNSDIKEIDRRLGENQDEARKLKSDKTKIQRDIDDILSKNINQLSLPI